MERAREAKHAYIRKLKQELKNSENLQQLAA
jgi:hypothetical protein